jgi:hypothetical protein
MTRTMLATFLFIAALATAQRASIANSAKPHLPLADYKACPGEQMRSVVHRWKIDKGAVLYSSWRDKRTTTGAVKTGEQVELLDSVNVTREPDTALILPSGLKSLVQAKNLPFKVGDVVLRYGRNDEGYWNLWVNGVWFTEYFEKVVEKDSWCGFADKNECTIRITKRGVKEWWVQVRTDTGNVGWARTDDRAFGDLCMAD